MKKYENECCGCESDGYPCIGTACPNISVPHLICDKCKEDVEDLYKTKSGELCEECVLGMFEKVRID